MNTSRGPQDRRARLSAMQAAAQRSERRRTLAILGPIAAVTAVLVAYAVIGVMGAKEERDEAAEAASRPVDGVQTFSDLTNNHVDGPVDYPQTPSVGGDHAAVWLNCGVYSQPVDSTQATHSLEHGAVWIGYDPQLEANQLSALEELAEANDYTILSPVDGMASPVTASAWGAQLQLGTAEDSRLATFVAKYQLSDQAPEPGAPCTGGTGGS